MMDKQQEQDPRRMKTTQFGRLALRTCQSPPVAQLRAHLITFPRLNRRATHKTRQTWLLDSALSGRGRRCIRETLDRKSQRISWLMQTRQMNLPFLPLQLRLGITHFQLLPCRSWLHWARNSMASHNLALTPPPRPHAWSCFHRPALWSNNRTIRTSTGAQDQDQDNPEVRSAITADIRFRRSLCSPTIADPLNARVAVFQASPFRLPDETGPFLIKHINHVAH